ncbi:hypothetical protein F2Q70_00011278 [Brassica cretica]|uniref:Uncharacterized protein n=2 Tax=Brassica cretica TaxID=69181 RepID=A0A8S9M163_BRACR|nr:hypothetical protein F2Q70_00011278 [Brassica cretica]
MTSRKRSSKKKTSPQSSSGNPCTNEEIVPKEEFEVEQEAYWDALCGSITPSPESPERGCVSSPGGWGECGGSSEGFFTCYEAFLTRCRMWFPIPEAIVCALDHFVLSTSQLNVAALQNFLGVLIQSYELRMDLSPDDFEGLWSKRKTLIDYSYRMAPKRHMSIIQGHTSNAKGWFESNNILPATPRDLFAKRDLLRNGPFFWDSFTLDRIRNAVALYRS